MKQISEKEKIAWIRLARSENVGPITFRNLLAQFGVPSEALKQINAMAKRGGRNGSVHIASEKEAVDEVQKAAAMKAQLILSCEERYPARLQAIEDKPPVLTVKGHLSLLKEKAVAIVGTRNASLNGKRIASGLAKELAQAGVVVVSGLARGVDTAAHEGVLSLNETPAMTIAVVGTGLDVVYPAENEKLAEKIGLSALIVSEFPFGVKPLPSNFPKRNRIISGLSQGVVVVEAQARSGSLITARLALEQGREVFAVPGSPVDPRSEGTNRLLKQGAFLVENAQDILNEIGYEREFEFSDVIHENEFEEEPLQIDEKMLDEVRQTVLKNLNVQTVPINSLIEECALPTHLVNVVLTELELAGRIQRFAGNKVAMLPE